MSGERVLQVLCKVLCAILPEFLFPIILSIDCKRLLELILSKIGGCSPDFFSFDFLFCFSVANATHEMNWESNRTEDPLRKLGIYFLFIQPPSPCPSSTCTQATVKLVLWCIHFLWVFCVVGCGVVALLVFVFKRLWTLPTWENINL